MKKTLLIVAAAAMILGLAGCNNQGLKAEAGSWGSQKVTKDDKGVHKAEVVVTLDADFTPTWYKWTDIDGNVLETQPTVTKESGKITFAFKDWSKVPTLYGTDETENMVLYMDSSDGTKDVRGRICVYRDKIVTVPYAKYKEALSAVTQVTITNDEPDANSLFTNGNYEVTEIWTLTPKVEGKAGIGETYVANDGLKIKFPQNKGLKYGESKTVLVKAEGIVGLYQPKRSKTTDGKEAASKDITAESITTAADFTTAEGGTISRVEAYHLQGLSGEALVKEYKKNNADIIFGNKMGAKHGTATINTSAFGTYYFKHDNTITRWKAAENDYVSEVTAMPADLK